MRERAALKCACAAARVGLVRAVTLSTAPQASSFIHHIKIYYASRKADVAQLHRPLDSVSSFPVREHSESLGGRAVVAERETISHARCRVDQPVQDHASRAPIISGCKEHHTNRLKLHNTKIQKTTSFSAFNLHKHEKDHA